MIIVPTAADLPPATPALVCTAVELGDHMLTLASQHHDWGGTLTALVLLHRTRDGQITWSMESLSSAGTEDVTSTAIQISTLAELAPPTITGKLIGSVVLSEALVFDDPELEADIARNCHSGRELYDRVQDVIATGQALHVRTTVGALRCGWNFEAIQFRSNAKPRFVRVWEHADPAYQQELVDRLRVLNDRVAEQQLATSRHG
jgi:hypothetical protein